MNKKYQEVEKLLINAYYQLLDCEPYENITVTQVCQYANVSRKSYYHHFQNNDQILAMIMRKKGQQFQEYCDKENSVINKDIITYEEYYLAYQRFFNFWFSKENKKFLGILTKQKLLSQFSDYFIKYEDFSCVQYDLNHHNSSPLLYVYYPHLANAILLKCLEQWANRGFIESCNDLAEIMMGANEIFSKHKQKENEK